MIKKAYKYRIYPNKKQRELLEKHFGASRWIFNYGLDRKIKAYKKNKKNVSCFEIIKELPKLKKEYPWLKEINAQSLQMSLRHLDNAYTSFFRKKSRFPKFKSKKDKQSFSIPQGNKVDFKRSRVYFIKIGWLKAKIDRRIEGKIIRATISKNKIDQYFVSYTVETPKNLPEKKKVKEKTTIGIDLGLKDFAVLSNGERIKAPKFLRESEQRLKVLQRRASRKQKGSNNRKEANYKVAKLHNKISNQRSNFLHNLTYRLTHENQVDSIAIENLSVENMIKNHRLAKSIFDASWSEFVRQLQYKCEWYGKNLLIIGRFEPSSKTCHCGYTKRDLKLNERKWTCPKCSKKNDRDLLAAQNIKDFALSGRLSPVEPVELSHQRSDEAGINNNS